MSGQTSLVYSTLSPLCFTDCSSLCRPKNRKTKQKKGHKPDRIGCSPPSINRARKRKKKKGMSATPQPRSLVYDRLVSLDSKALGYHSASLNYTKKKKGQVGTQLCVLDQSSLSSALDRVMFSEAL